MTKPAAKQEVESVLTSIRRLVGETIAEESEHLDRSKTEMLVLTPQLRVAASADILQLMPEQAVASTDAHHGFQEAPAVFGHARTLKGGDAPVSHLGARSDASELSAKIAALETAIAKTVGEWEPDDTGRDAYSGTQPPAMTWRDDIDLDAHGTPLQLSEVEPEEGADAATDALVLDEEALREIVVQIIKSELQGELGERITRNVRKLVRQEIQRSFSARAMQ